MTAEHYDCVSKIEYERRINAIADSLQDIGMALSGEAKREWMSAAAVVRAAVPPSGRPESTPEARLGLSTKELLLAREARSSAALDRDQTHSLDE